MFLKYRIRVVVLGLLVQIYGFHAHNDETVVHPDKMQTLVDELNEFRSHMATGKLFGRNVLEDPMSIVVPHFDPAVNKTYVMLRDRKSTTIRYMRLIEVEKDFKLIDRLQCSESRIKDLGDGRIAINLKMYNADKKKYIYNGLFDFLYAYTEKNKYGVDQKIDLPIFRKDFKTMGCGFHSRLDPIIYQCFTCVLSPGNNSTDGRVYDEGKVCSGCDGYCVENKGLCDGPELKLPDEGADAKSSSSMLNCFVSILIVFWVL